MKLRCVVRGGGSSYVNRQDCQWKWLLDNEIKICTLGEAVLRMSTDNFVSRTWLLDNEIKVCTLGEEVLRISIDKIVSRTWLLDNEI